MKTLADFKRRLHIGAMLTTIKHNPSKQDDGTFKECPIDVGIRKITRLQTNAFALEGIWVAFPKAKDVIFYPENPDKITIQIKLSDEFYPLLTLTLVNQTQCTKN